MMQSRRFAELLVPALAAMAPVPLLSCAAGEDTPWHTTGAASGAGGGATGGVGSGSPDEDLDLDPTYQPDPAGDGPCHDAPDVCSPGESLPCWDGPPELADTDACKSGKRYCNQFGSAFSGCRYQILPTPDACAQYGYSCSDTPCLPEVTLEMFDVSAPTEVWSRGGPLAFDGGNGLYRARSVGPNSPGDGSIEHVSGAQVLWTAELPGGWTRSLALDAKGGVLAAVQFDPAVAGKQAALIAFHEDGTVRWTKDVHDIGGLISVVRLGPSGDIWIAGTFTSTLDLGSGPLTGPPFGYVARLDPQGGVRWVSTFETESVGDMSVDEDGRALIGTTIYEPEGECARPAFRVTAVDDIGGAQVLATWRTDEGGPVLTALLPTSDGGFFAAGRMDTDPGTTFDFGTGPVDGTVFAGRFTGEGEVVWITTADVATGGSYGSWMALRSKEDPIWVLQNAYDIIVRDLEAGTGVTRHERLFPVDFGQQGMALPFRGVDSVAIAPDDSVMLSGNFAGKFETGNGAIDSTGWTRAFFLTLPP